MLPVSCRLKWNGSNRKLVSGTSIAFSSRVGGMYATVDITKEINDTNQVTPLKHVCWLRDI